MSTPLPIENPYCLFCGEMVVNPTAKSQCGKCGALACESCQKQGHGTCTECGSLFGQGTTASAPPTTPTPQPVPVPPKAPPAPPSYKASPPPVNGTSPNAPGPAQAQSSAPVPPMPGPGPVPGPQPTPTASVPPPSPLPAPNGQFDLSVHQTSTEGWKQQGALISPLLGPRLVFWSLLMVLSIGAIGFLTLVRLLSSK